MAKGEMQLKTIAFSGALLFFSILLSSPVCGYEWNSQQGFQGWGSFNVGNARVTGESVTLYRQSSGADMILQLPKGVVHGAFSIRVRLSTMAINSHIVCVLQTGGQKVQSELPLLSGRAWKEYVFNFNNLDSSTLIDDIALHFINCDSVEIRGLTAEGPSFSEFFELQGLRAHNVNFLHPFTLYGYSLNLWVCAVILTSGLGAAVFYRLKGKKGVLAFTGIIFLACYFAIDVREDVEELYIMTTTHKDYMGAAPGDRMYHWNDNLVEFSDFIRRNINPSQEEINFFGGENRYFYLRYLLYPMNLVQKKDTLARVNIFSESHDARLMGNTLLMDGKETPNGIGMPFGVGSFIYLTR